MDGLIENGEGLHILNMSYLMMAQLDYEDEQYSLQL